MLAHSLQRNINGEGGDDLPDPPEPSHGVNRGRFDAGQGPIRPPPPSEALTKALALIMGPESMVVFKDVLRMNGD